MLSYRRKDLIAPYARLNIDDAHFHDGAVIVSLLFLAFTVATTVFVDVCKQSPVRLPDLTPKIVDTALMLLGRIGQGGCRGYF